MLNFRQLCFFCSQHKATSKKGFQLSRSQLRCRLFEINDFISNVWVIIKIQRMSSQIKTDKTDDNLEPPKKYKRSTLNQIEQSLRRNKCKMGDTIKNGDLEEQKNKITNYFTARPVQIRRLDTVEVKKQQKNNKQVKIQFMEEQLKAKEKVIQQFKDKKLAEEERLNKIKFETKQFKNKVKPLIAKNMLQIAEAKRAERREKRVNFGYFTEGMRSFVEGQALVSIRMLVAQKQASIKKLQEARKSAKANTQDYVRLLSSLEFTHRELNQLKKQLLLREKELASYKDRLKLAEKQNKSYFSREGWPIIYDRYQTLELLGSGGFGEVYKCYDLDNQKFVAIKRMIFPERGDSAQRQDFFRHVLRQAQIQKQLSHPNIAKFQSVIEVDKNKNILVFELEYCGGPQLSVYLRKYSCLQQKEAKIIMKQLFSAIDYLSKLKQRIIHYDLKPSNIMFHQGIVKILDFGLSKIMRGEESKMQLTSQGVGTYWYLPPQTFDEYSPQINSKVDVWSLGVIFFELLYGRKPFGHGIGQQQIYVNGVILRAFKVQFPTDNPHRYKVSQSAKDFIRKCLEYRQDQRLSPQQAYNHEYFRK